MNLTAQQPAGEYRSDIWQIVVNDLGFSSIYETDEDGNPGDLVVHCFGNSEHLLCAAPQLRKALRNLLAIAGTPITDTQARIFADARAALQLAEQVAK